MKEDGRHGWHPRTLETGLHPRPADGPAERKAAAPPGTDTFQSVLTKEERAEQAAKAPDLPNFSKMTDWQKLSALATLHDATDYSGMTDAETYKLINDRFEAAFPHLGAYQSELIGRDSVNYFGTANMARPVTGMSTLITTSCPASGTARASGISPGSTGKPITPA